ncbi:MAG: iron-containing alcohol dehydrogenase [Firmicutes bacterium]|nr:iron-containing alcohol dehydrogenase [Bacillota bacterium]
MDRTFSFHLPPRIEFGEGMLKRLPALVKETLKGSRVFVVTDPGVRKAGIVDPLLEDMRQAGFEIRVFDNVKPNPRDIDCEEGGLAIREFEAHMILAVGGGSVLDSAKAIAVLQANDAPLRQYEGRDRFPKDVVPIVAVPTTAGTGSEVTRSSVITDTGRKFKMTVKSVRLAPRLAVVDPATTHNLPKGLTASTGMDAFVHAIESYTCKASNPFSQAWAKEAMRYTFRNLKEAVLEGTRESRNIMMLGSVMAGVAFSHSDVAAVHCMAEAIGGLYDTPHGVANSMFLPVVTEFNAQANPEVHAEVARICGLPVDVMPPREAAAFLVEELERLSEDVGIPEFGSQPGVSPDDFDRLAEASFINGSTPSNCRTISRADYLDLFRKAYRA